MKLNITAILQIELIYITTIYSYFPLNRSSKMDEEALYIQDALPNDSQQISRMSRARKSEALLVASRRGKVELIKLLLELGANPNSEDELGCSPLMFVAAQGLLDCLESMVSSPVRCIIHKRTGAQQTALHFASERGQYKCVERLIQLGCMVNVSDDWGMTPLMQAVNSGSVETVQVLLNNGARMEMTDLRGFNALMHSARGGHDKILQVLLDHGSSVNVPGQKTSPLHQASTFGHIKCVELLLKAGTLAFMRDIHGQLPIELATQTDQFKVVEYLVKYRDQRASYIHKDDKNAALVSAAKSNAIQSLAILLENGANPETWVHGVPTLFVAVDQNNVEVVQCLIRHHCHVNRRLRRIYLFNTELRDLCTTLQGDHICALTVATLRGYGRLLRILLHAGCKIGPFSELLAANLVPDSILKDQPLMLWALERATRPMSLMELSRNAIREQLIECQTQGKVNSLPVPEVIKMFLTFADVEAF